MRVRGLLMFPFVLLIQTIKVAIGVNGEYRNENGPSLDQDAIVPQGLLHAMTSVALANLTLQFCFHLSQDQTLLVLVAGLMYVFFMGLFVFPLIRRMLGIYFPTGNWFYAPRRGEPA